MRKGFGQYGIRPSREALGMVGKFGGQIARCNPAHFVHLGRVGRKTAYAFSQEHVVVFVLAQAVGKGRAVHEGINFLDACNTRTQLFTHATRHGFFERFACTRMRAAGIRPQPARMVLASSALGEQKLNFGGTIPIHGIIARLTHQHNGKGAMKKPFAVRTLLRCDVDLPIERIDEDELVFARGIALQVFVHVHPFERPEGVSCFFSMGHSATRTPETAKHVIA